MADPAYTVTVYLPVIGTVYEVTHGDPNPEVLEPTILADPLSYAWGFQEGVIPNPLDPSVASLEVWSTSRSIAPRIVRGDMIRLAITAGGTSAPAIVDVPLRVTEVTADMVPGSDYPFRQSVKAADLLADLGSWFPGPASGAIGGGVKGWRHRLAWTGAWGARSVGVPTWWPARPSGLGFALNWLGNSAESLFGLILRSWAPSGVHHAVTPYVAANYPAGYEYADARPDRPDILGWTPVTDVNSNIRYMVMPAGRRVLDTPPLPLRFTSSDGQLVLTSPPLATAGVMPAVSADVCVLPTSLRQGREHAPNVIRANGINQNLDGSDKDNLEVASTLEVQSSADVSAYGPRGRDLDTMLMLRAYNVDPEAPTAPQADAVTEVMSYLADASQLAEVWTFDEFTIYASEMSAADAERILPILAPAYMDKGGGDKRIVRHLTIHSIDPEVRPDPDRSTASGFIVAGQLVISGGELTFNVTTQPGQPVSGGAAPAPITVGEFTGAAYSALLVPNVHPNITIADLASVDA